jgi:predicted metalloprotease
MTLIHRALVEQHQIQGSLWLPFLYAVTPPRVFSDAQSTVR